MAGYNDLPADLEYNPEWGGRQNLLAARSGRDRAAARQQYAQNMASMSPARAALMSVSEPDPGMFIQRDLQQRGMDNQMKMYGDERNMRADALAQQAALARESMVSQDRRWQADHDAGVQAQQAQVLSSLIPTMAGPTAAEKYQLDSLNQYLARRDLTPAERQSAMQQQRALAGQSDVRGRQMLSQVASLYKLPLNLGGNEGQQLSGTGAATNPLDALMVGTEQRHQQQAAQLPGMAIGNAMHSQVGGWSVDPDRAFQESFGTPAGQQMINDMAQSGKSDDEIRKDIAMQVVQGGGADITPKQALASFVPAVGAYRTLFGGQNGPASGTGVDMLTRFPDLVISAVRQRRIETQSQPVIGPQAAPVAQPPR